MSKLSKFSDNDVKEIAKYIVDNDVTVRQYAVISGMGKSNVHKLMIERLPKISCDLYSQVRRVFDIHKSERALRGGMALREKYIGMIRTK